MKRHPVASHARARDRTGLLAALLALGLAGAAQAAPAGFKILKPEAGGLVPHPVITAITGGSQLTLTWSGFGGPYNVQVSPTIAAPTWQTVAGPLDAGTVTLPVGANVGFFRVEGGASYVGASTCAQCHPATHDRWTNTIHASALETLKKIGQGQNVACLPCHTVGFGLTTGFKDETATPHLAGVQCENCHGPGGAHAAAPGDLAKRPVKTPNAMLCGGCHTDFHHPTYDEWTTSAHAGVTAELVSSLKDPVSGPARMLACGPCHSGAVRLTLLSNLERPADKQLPLPSGEDAATVSQTCGVCHDPHGGANVAQLRNPTKSLVAFSYSTATNTTFALQYNPAVNACGQCHNMRGATWTGTSRPPHYSPQYNILIGSGGVEVGTPAQSPHRNNENQCAGCHTHSHGPATPTPTEPLFTGHDFTPSLEACVECHGDVDTAAFKRDSTQADIQRKIDTLKTKLDTWATTKADASLAKYGKRAWEFTNAGNLSNPTADPTLTGPTTAEQAKIPDDIKQARFNLYLVVRDASKGVHNASYTRHLLKVGTDKVNALLQ